MSISGGILLALLAGILNGSFAAPTKYTSRWKWENVWAIWATVAFFVVPWLLAIATVPHLFAVYGGADARTLLTVIGFGAAYGVAAVCFGLGVEAIGIALNFAIALGLSTAIGSLVPLLSLHPEQMFTRKGLTVEAGIAVALLGIIVCAVAGRAKERELVQTAPVPDQPTKTRTSFKVGLAFAIIAGIGSPFINFGLAFGGPLLTGAAAQGASAATQANVIWPPLLTATLIPYLAYCTYLWRKNKSLQLYALPGTTSYWLLGALMGVLWMSSIAIFGAASATMAEMGPVLGWPLFMSAIIITSNVWGFATGEWRRVRRPTVFTVSIGMLLLILGFCILAWSFRIA
ncbi:MAG: L-rhamnose/proton symporter RhaT [Bryobacteraceae bacterium]